MDWPENYQVSVGGESLTPEDLRRRGIGHVDFRLTKPMCHFHVGISFKNRFL